MVAESLTANAGVEETEIVVIKTMGDQVLDRALSEVGGKGLFTKEIEAALLEGAVDCAVHSGKDLETILPEGTTLGAFLPREDVRDVFIDAAGCALLDLSEGSARRNVERRLRRQAHRLPPRPAGPSRGILRGNVQTRLCAKAGEGECERDSLAHRLWPANTPRNGPRATEISTLERFLPA